MKQILKPLLTTSIILCIVTISGIAQNYDWRNVINSNPIYTSGYCDQPYVVLLQNGKWLCVFTTNLGHEGSKGQHIVSSISEDQGKTWSEPVRIEEPHKESASWAMPYLTDYGRVYVFYSYNGDKIHELNEQKNIREDMLGWYCYKFSDNDGKTWSERYRLPVRETYADKTNDWGGKVQIFWGVGKPIDFEGGMMLSFSKIGRYMLEYSEGWLFNCMNINHEKNPNKLKWSMLPDSDNGIKNPEYGLINSEHNIFQLNNGTLYCMNRTVSGYPLESYSTDGGKSWTTPQPPVYENGIRLKNPRACPRIWKCKNGKYLFWYHNNGGWNFGTRNPAWISGGIEKDGKIIWGQPEILLYEDDKNVRMSYPDLIEQDGKYWITETNKANARCHTIPNEFLNMLWSQFEINAIAKNNLVAEWKEDEIPESGQLKVPIKREGSYTDGFTIDFRLVLATLSPGQLLMSSKEKNGKLIEIKTADFGAIEIILSDGEHSDSWSSDPGLIKATGLEYCISVIVDNGPRIVQFVTDGTINNGRNMREYGWGRYTVDMKDLSFNNIEIAKLAGESVNIKGKISNLRLYNRPLMNTEIIGNHNYFRSNLFVKAQTSQESFFQEIKTDIQLPKEAGKNVICLFQVNNNIVGLTPNGIYKFSNGKWRGKPCGTGFQTATLDLKGNVWMANQNSIQNEDGSVKFTLPSTLINDTILCLFWENKTLHVGTSNGLLSYNKKWQTTAIAQGRRINSIALDKSDQLWLATNKGLLKRTSMEWRNLDEMIMAKGTYEKYFKIHIPEGTNDLLFSSPISVSCIADNGQHWMWSGKDGLPYGPVTTIKSHNEILWFGTDKGAAKKDNKWHYYHDKRWLPNNKINDILPIDEHTVWIATPDGISQIQQVEMTLEEKAAHYEKVVDARHNRRGLINVSHLRIPGDISTSKMKNEDNDGLWTSTYLAAECFRFAVTKSDEAKKNAIRTFEALERLETVTGIPGLPARSYAKKKDVVEQSRSPHPKIWRPSPHKEWQWLDDCSSDEIVGHMFAISVFYDLVADNKLKKRIKEQVSRIMDHIIDNDFHLIDFDGKPTRWGVYHPDSLNHSKNWAYEKNLYSLELLSHLKTAVYITENQKYEKTYRYLIENHNYAENTVEAKMHSPFEKSYAEDILTYFPYYCLSRYARDDEFWPLYKKSIERTWPVSQPDRMPIWNVIASVVLEKDCDIEIAKEELELFPLDLIDWRMNNSHRWDLIKDELVDRGGNRQATRPIPTPEARIFRWNTNPYEFDAGSNGKREVSGTYFLLPYWMARYHKLFN